MPLTFWKISGAVDILTLLVYEINRCWSEASDFVVGSSAEPVSNLELRIVPLRTIFLLGGDDGLLATLQSVEHVPENDGLDCSMIYLSKLAVSCSAKVDDQAATKNCLKINHFANHGAAVAKRDFLSDSRLFGGILQIV